MNVVPLTQRGKPSPSCTPPQMAAESGSGPAQVITIVPICCGLLELQ